VNITKHAKKRCRQRGLPEKDIKIILERGSYFLAPGNALKVMITKGDKQKIIADAKRRIQMAEKLQGRVVIQSLDGSIITTY
jgi:hypothetical protein